MTNRITITVTVIAMVAICSCAGLNPAEKQIVGTWYRMTYSGAIGELTYGVKEQYDFARTGMGHIAVIAYTNDIVISQDTFKFKWKIKSDLLRIRLLPQDEMWLTYDLKYINSQNIKIDSINYYRDE